MRVILSTLLATAVFAGVFLFAQTETATFPKLRAGDPLPAGLFIDLYKAVNPAVVNIFTTYLPKGRMARVDGRDPFFDLLERFARPAHPIPQQALGTGFVIREDGLIVTNNHVIDQADVIKVQIEERNRQSFEAKLIGKDPRTDVALIKIDAKRKLAFARMGSSADVQVGEWVAAFGNPYGYGHTITKGIISAIGREIDELNLNPFMQTDASINPGNSGGPLVNTQGLVIGVNTAVDARAQGIGFVIPIDSVKAILPGLEKDGSVKRGFLGVMLADLEADEAQEFKVPGGAIVAERVPGSPADRAGLIEGDLITDYAGKPILNSRDLTRAVIGTKIGTTVAIKILRDGQPLTVKATIIAPSEALVAGPNLPAGKKRGRTIKGLKAPFNLGFAVADFSVALSEQFGIGEIDPHRPIVVLVEPGTEAARAGLVAGDVILDVNRVETPRAQNVVASFKPGAIHILRVLKGDRTVRLPLRVP